MGALFFKLSQNINTLNFPSNESMLQLAYVMNNTKRAKLYINN